MATGMVYFAEAVGGNAVKIGYCWLDLHNRIKSMQSSNHCELRCVAVVRGGPELEAEMHERFSHLRIRGEWFTPDRKLRAFIRANKIKPVVMPKPVRVRCYKCCWEGYWRRLNRRCPKCNYWKPLAVYGEDRK